MFSRWFRLSMHEPFFLPSCSSNYLITTPSPRTPTSTSWKLATKSQRPTTGQPPPPRTTTTAARRAKLEAQGQGTKASLAGSLAWKHKGHSAVVQFFRSSGRAGLKLRHVGEMSIQTIPNLRIGAMYVEGDEDENIWLWCSVARRG